MRIGIDARLYSQTGVGRYLRNLIEQLQFIDDRNEYVIYLRSQEYNLVNLPSNRWHKRRADIPWHTIAEQIKLPSLLLADNLDVAHFPYFNVPIFYPRKYLLTIHDLIVDHFDTGRASTLPYPLYVVKRLGYKISLTLGIKKANWITAISNATRQEIIEHYGVSKNKITVTYDALDNQFKRMVKTHKPKNYYEYPYILYVGNAYPHKNLERLLKALKLIREKIDIRLVLAGDDKYFYPRLKEFAKKIGLSKEVIFFGSANDQQLVNLYSFAKCLVSPSLMEGFGLPNLEALACNILPVASDIAVFREIWKDDMYYFDPTSEDDMADKITEVLTLSSSRIQNKLSALKKNLNNFSWEKSARQTLEIYEQINK